jgi:hypothetical protein
MFDQRDRLRVVHNHKIVLKKIADAVLVNHLLEYLLFDLGKIDLGALERVMHLLGDREEIGCALDHPPLGAKTEAVHEQRERGKCLGYAAAVICRIEIRDAQVLSACLPYHEYAELFRVR